MQLTTLISTVAVLAGATSLAAAQDYYLLKSQVTDPAGDQSYDGQFVVGFHVGAGQSATVLTPDEASARAAFLEDGVQRFIGSNGIPWSFDMSVDTAPSPSVEYAYVGLNAGVYDPGFSLDADNKLQWNANDFVAFAICPGTIPPYESQGVQSQVFWRGAMSPTDEGCTDVEFIAVPTTVEETE